MVAVLALSVDDQGRAEAHAVADAVLDRLVGVIIADMENVVFVQSAEGTGRRAFVEDLSSHHRQAVRISAGSAAFRVIEAAAVDTAQRVITLGKLIQCQAIAAVHLGFTDKDTARVKDDDHLPDKALFLYVHDDDAIAVFIDITVIVRLRPGFLFSGLWLLVRLHGDEAGIGGLGVVDGPVLVEDGVRLFLCQEDLRNKVKTPCPHHGHDEGVSQCGRRSLYQDPFQRQAENAAYDDRRQDQAEHTVNEADKGAAPGFLFLFFHSRAFPVYQDMSEKRTASSVKLLTLYFNTFSQT